MVTGCAAQTEPARFAEMAEVDAVLGNAEKLRPETWARLAGPEAARVAVGDVMAETKAPLAGEMSGHTFYADKWYGFDDAPYSAVRLLGVGVRLGDTETVEQLRLFDDALPAAIVEAVGDSSTV